MEKFTKWRDAQTGIHPFLTKNSVSTVSLIVGILLLPIKFICLMDAIILFYIFDIINVPLTNKVQSFLLRVSLAIFSIYNIPIKGKSHHNSLIISNHQSFIDILIYQYLYQPQFVYPVETKDDSTDIFILSFYQALKRSLFNTPFSKKTTLNSLSKSKPSIYFIEGTTANGKIVLHPRLEALQTYQGTMEISSLRYTCDFNLYYNQATSFILYIFGILSQMKCSVLVTISPLQDLEEETFTNYYRNHCKVATSSLTSYDKAEFVKAINKK
ncbi:Phospholipid/glycerol acyltransferase domain-containing protein [Entamoeba marina]